MFYVPGSAPDVNTDLPSGFSAAMIKRGILVFLKWSGSGWDPAGDGGGSCEVVSQRDVRSPRRMWSQCSAFKEKQLTAGCSHAGPHSASLQSDTTAFWQI